MLIGSIGCVVSVIFLCAMTAEFLDTTNKAGLRAAVFFVFFYIFWWCFFIDATQYIYLAGESSEWYSMDPLRIYADSGLPK